MKKKLVGLLTASMCAAIMMTGCISNASGESKKSEGMAIVKSQRAESKNSIFTYGDGSIENPWQIETSEQFEAMRSDLTAHYILNADVDLSNVKNFKPIGTFKPASDAEEDAETPNMEAAFTGTLNGNGHKVSNIKISLSTDTGVGIFGCVAGKKAGVENLKIENIDIEGGQYTGGLVGYSYYDTVIKNISIQGKSTVKGSFLVGGVSGASHSDIISCDVTANIELKGDDTQGAGIIVGGAEECSVENCSASGRVSALGTGCYSIGGLAGCIHNGEYAKNCIAKDVSIEVGNKGYLIGGLIGHAGMFEEGKTTIISDCSTENVAIQLGEGTDRIGGIVGGGFFSQKYIEYYPEPSAYRVTDCRAAGNIRGGHVIGAIAGYIYSNSTVESCTADVTVDGKINAQQIGGNGLRLDELN